MTATPAAVQTEKLAIDGGTPARHRADPPMFPGGNLIGAEEEQAVLEVLRSKRLFRYYGPEPGPSKVEQFEQAFAAHMGAPYALAVSSGTGALMCGAAGVGLGPGDEVIVPAFGFIAPVSGMALLGAVPVLAEVDDTLTLDPADVARKITPRTKAIVSLHMRGAPAQLDQLLGLAHEHGLRVIEDVAQAAGGSYHGRRLGTIGDVGCFSLQFNKIITTGEGGVLLTSNPEIHRRAMMLHDSVAGPRQGIPPEEVLLGMNLRMPELSGAVAGAQLGRLEEILAAMRARKHALKTGMADALAQAGGQFRRLSDPEGDAAVSLVFFLPTAAIAERAVAALSAEGIGARSLLGRDRADYHVYTNWAPILAQRSWSADGGPWAWGAPVEYRRDMCPQTIDLLTRSVHLDVNPLLTDDDVAETVTGLNKVLTALA